MWSCISSAANGRGAAFFMQRKGQNMKSNEITIDVNANLIVDRSTAEACLKLVELYVINTGARIKVVRLDDGNDSYRFVHDLGGAND